MNFFLEIRYLWKIIEYVSINLCYIFSILEWNSTTIFVLTIFLLSFQSKKWNANENKIGRKKILIFRGCGIIPCSIKLTYLVNHFDSSSKTEHEYWLIFILDILNQNFPQRRITAARFRNSIGHSLSSSVLSSLFPLTCFLTMERSKIT